MLLVIVSSCPLIASVDEHSDAARLVQRSGAGVWVPPESPEHLAEAILKLRDDPVTRTNMGERGRAYALKYHSPDSAVESFVRLFDNYVIR